ncbi:MAG: DUF2631 domain-containing protein, partial [Corynebacterium sp.]|nr:DUF2631 domain-containing protein [Corynebacterium sp.]
MSSHKSAPEVFDGVSTNDVPSAGFGWSRTPRTGVQVAGWISVLVLLAYNFGNHRGHVETIWLFALTIVISLGLLIHLFQPKLSQVRTITSHNKPVGHVEPDWVYDQKTVSGAYAQLSDRELRSLNIDPARLARTHAASPAG